MSQGVKVNANFPLSCPSLMMGFNTLRKNGVAAGNSDATLLPMVLGTTISSTGVFRYSEARSASIISLISLIIRFPQNR